MSAATKSPNMDINSPLVKQLIQKLTSILEMIGLNDRNVESNMFGGSPQDDENAEKHASLTINNIPINVEGFEPSHASISFEYKFFVKNDCNSLFEPKPKDEYDNPIKTSFKAIAGAYSENWIWVVKGETLNSQAVGINENEDIQLAKTVLDAVYEQLETPKKLHIVQWILDKNKLSK